MSEVKHTPGPWGISGGRLDIRANYHGARFIAAVYQPSTHELAPMDSESLANANLISAAPELLEALEALIEIEAKHGYTSWPEIIAARAAIAKAKGTL